MFQFLVADKLHWTFKLYDKDGSGEIDPDEMEDIFRKLCKIAAGIESDQRVIQEKEKAKEKLKEERLKAKEEEQKDREMEDARQGIQKANFYSRKMNRVVGARTAINGMSVGFKKRGARRKSCTDLNQTKEPTKEEEEKKAVLDIIIKELKDPTRDCNNFDPGRIFKNPCLLYELHVSGKRARELFDALDDDGNGVLTEEEFVEGCLSDEAFVTLLEDFNGDFIWG